MDDKLHQEAVKQAVKAKFKGKDSLTSRAVPRYPDSSEREFKRITSSYVEEGEIIFVIG